MIVVAAIAVAAIVIVVVAYLFKASLLGSIRRVPSV